MFEKIAYFNRKLKILFKKFGNKGKTTYLCSRNLKRDAKMLQ
jgi:hypothetical protein